MTAEGAPSGGRPAASLTADVIVIGAGVAGTGAAIAAAQSGASAILLDGGAGASTLATGAVDAVQWRRKERSDDPIASGSMAVLEALGGAFAVPDGGVTLLTMAGVVRPARGHDRALLDIRSVRGRIGVAACRRSGWDAAALVAAWREGREGVDAFEALDAALVRYTDEDAIPDADFAARHDDDDRQGWLAERLREALARANGRYSAIVLPPMLGLKRARAEALSRMVGIPCGEAIALPGGPAGFRFEHARDRALASAHVPLVRARAVGVHRRGTLWRVTGEGGEAFDASAVILATGGLIGGGLAYAPSDAIFATELPPIARPPLRLTVDAPFALGAWGRPLEIAGSLFGYAPESLSRPFAGDALIERAGVLPHDEDNGRHPAALLAAGDVVADEPRTWLGALGSGARAGARAAMRGRPTQAAAIEPTVFSSTPARPAKSPDEAPPSRP
jgi:glycerol-3-phosphate dehydrogenase subunit B